MGTLHRGLVSRGRGEPAAGGVRRASWRRGGVRVAAPSPAAVAPYTAADGGICRYHVQQSAVPLGPRGPGRRHRRTRNLCHAGFVPSRAKGSGGGGAGREVRGGGGGPGERGRRGTHGASGTDLGGGAGRLGVRTSPNGVA